MRVSWPGRGTSAWRDRASDLPIAPSPIGAMRNGSFLTTPGVMDSLLGPVNSSSAVTPATPPASLDVSPATDHDDAGQDGVVLQAPLPYHPRHRPIIQALAPQHYRVQFTIGQQAHDDLRTVQALLRRENPSGDPAAIFERALALLRKEVEKSKLGPIVPSHPERRQARGLVSRPRAVRVRVGERTEMRRAQLPGASPHPAVRDGGAGHGRQHRAAMPAAQSVRG